MRNVARNKLAYFPFPPDEGSRLRQLLNYPSEAVSVLDPCAGTGAALRQLTDDANTNRYAVELDAERARLAEESGIGTIHANTFDVHAKVESFSLLYLNPPYDSEVSSFDNKRMELLFLRRTLRWLVNGGILLMVVPHGQLQECVPLLSEAFKQFSVFRLSDPESERFDQVALLAVRTRVTAAAYESNRQKLIEAISKHARTLLERVSSCLCGWSNPGAYRREEEGEERCRTPICASGSLSISAVRSRPTRISAFMSPTTWGRRNRHIF